MFRLIVQIVGTNKEKISLYPYIFHSNYLKDQPENLFSLHPGERDLQKESTSGERLCTKIIHIILETSVQLFTSKLVGPPVNSFQMFGRLG